MHVNTRTRLLNRIQFILFVVLFVTSIGLLAWISTQFTFRSDWTAGQRLSLSTDTVDLLSQLESPVHVRSYQLEDIAMQRAVTDILQRYRQHNPQQFNFELVNPDLQPDLARADGISRPGQTLIRHNNKTEVIDALSEQQLTNTLLRLTRDSTAVVNFLQGHGERDPDDSSALGYKTLVQQLSSKGFEINTVNLLKDSLTTHTGTLVIAAPERELLAGEIEVLKRYLDQGHNLLWLQDPKLGHELLSIANILDITFIDGVVVDNNPNLRNVLGLSHPAQLPILSYKLHPITEKMKYFTLLITAAAVRPQVDTNWHSTALLLTEDTSWAETDGFIIDVALNTDRGDTPGPLSIGLALERDINTRKQRVVVIGDSDFLSNNNIGHGANLLFAMNTLNWLSQDDKLISIMPKSAPDIQLDLNDTQVAAMGLIFLVILPIGLFGAGILIWYQRRKR